MTDPLAQFDDAKARLEEIVAQARDHTGRAERLAEGSHDMKVTVRSPRGELMVTSRVGGAITAIQFTDAALTLSPHTLAQLTVTTIGRAQNAAAMRFAESAADQLGANSALAESLRADAERAFPSPSGGVGY